VSPWTADILTARGVPTAALFPALDLLGTHRHAYPRSRRLLAAAHSALADRVLQVTGLHGHFAASHSGAAAGVR
jgi:hypothetical protein